MALLGVNIDHVATLRQVRQAKSPDPVAAALIAEMHGADNITCHLREDRRHIQDRDLRILKETVKTPLNLEMAATSEMVHMALEIRPHTVTLVPERREELTTEGGLNLTSQPELIAKTIATLKEGSIEVSLFIDPDVDSIKLAHRLGAAQIEIHTGKYANANGTGERQRELGRIEESIRFAQKLKLVTHAGHGIDYNNVRALAKLGGIESYQIGHAIVAKALFIGFGEAVRQMKQLVE